MLKGLIIKKAPSETYLFKYSSRLFVATVKVFNDVAFFWNNVCEIYMQCS